VTPDPARGNTAGVVVTYRPDHEFVIRAARLAAQVDRLIIVDNGSGSSTLESIRRWVVATPDVELIENGRNLGLAVALNQGAERAGALGYAWLLLSDQDSTVDDDLLDRLAETYRSCPFRERVKWIGANFRIPALGRNGYRESGRARFSTVAAAITSGSLLDVSGFADTGPFRSEFFVDLVDTEYCFRLRSLGYQVIVSSDPLMTHQIGHAQPRKIFGRVRNISHHSAGRRYLMTRNRVMLIRNYFWREPRWLAADVVRAMGELVAIFAYEQDALDKAWGVVRGLWDGLRGRLGPVFDARDAVSGQPQEDER
jgi:rhamnosyltransferase